MLAERPVLFSPSLPNNNDCSANEIPILRDCPVVRKALPLQHQI